MSYRTPSPSSSETSADNSEDNSPPALPAAAPVAKKDLSTRGFLAGLFDVAFSEVFSKETAARVTKACEAYIAAHGGDAGDALVPVSKPGKGGKAGKKPRQQRKTTAAPYLLYTTVAAERMRELQLLQDNKGLMSIVAASWREMGPDRQKALSAALQPAIEHVNAKLRAAEEHPDEAKVAMGELYKAYAADPKHKLKVNFDDALRKAVEAHQQEAALKAEVADNGKAGPVGNGAVVTKAKPAAAAPAATNAQASAATKAAKPGPSGQAAAAASQQNHGGKTPEADRHEKKKHKKHAEADEQNVKVKSRAAENEDAGGATPATHSKVKKRDREEPAAAPAAGEAHVHKKKKKKKDKEQADD